MDTTVDVAALAVRRCAELLASTQAALGQFASVAESNSSAAVNDALLTVVASSSSAPRPSHGAGGATAASINAVANAERARVMALEQRLQRRHGELLLLAGRHGLLDAEGRLMKSNGNGGASLADQAAVKRQRAVTAAAAAVRSFVRDELLPLPECKPFVTSDGRVRWDGGDRVGGDPTPPRSPQTPQVVVPGSSSAFGGGGEATAEAGTQTRESVLQLLAATRAVTSGQVRKDAATTQAAVAAKRPWDAYHPRQHADVPRAPLSAATTVARGLRFETRDRKVSVSALRLVASFAGLTVVQTTESRAFGDAREPLFASAA